MQCKLCFCRTLPLSFFSLAKWNNPQNDHSMKSKSYARERTKKELVEGGRKVRRCALPFYWTKRSGIQHCGDHIFQHVFAYANREIPWPAFSEHVVRRDKKQHLIFYVIYLWNFLTFRKAACASVSTGRAGWVGFMASNFASSLAFRARSIFLLASSLEAVAKYTVVFQSHWGKKWWKERTCTLFSLLQKKKQQQHLICTCHARDMNLCAEQVGHQHLPPSPLPLLFLKTFSQRRFLRLEI